MTEQSQLVELTAGIIAGFVSNNALRVAELPELIAAVHASVAGIALPKPVELAAPAPVPAVSIKKSIAGDFLICLDDGKKFRSLKRHLATLGMTPGEYRAKWGLPGDYPMVAPGYAAERSALAKALGLGQMRGKRAASQAAKTPSPAPADEAKIATPSKRRGRPAKATKAA